MAERWLASGFQPLKCRCPTDGARGAPALIALAPCLLLSALTVGVGCASQSQTSGRGGFAQRQTKGPPLVVEEFDPRLVREDLLLIQPNFSPPAVSPVAAEDRADDALVADAAEEQRESSPELNPPPSPVDAPDVAVYRVQVIALSIEISAAALALELELLLDVPVVLEPQGDLFAIRAGELGSRDEAEDLRDRITALRGDYREAFVIEGHRPAETDVLADAPVDSLLADDLPWESIETEEEEDREEYPQPLELVSTDGWRVLIDQFLSFAAANRLHQKAMRRLDRADIYIDFQEPYYKVEVGNYRSRAEAHEATEQIKRRGYSKALKVRTQVSVPKEESE